MAVKLTSKEDTLSDDGIVAVGEFDDVPPPPHASATSPATISAGTSLTNLNVVVSS